MSEPQYCPIAQKFCNCERTCDDAEAIAAYVDALIRRDIAARHEGGPEHDKDTRGNPL